MGEAAPGPKRSERESQPRRASDSWGRMEAHGAPQLHIQEGQPQDQKTNDDGGAHQHGVAHDPASYAPPDARAVRSRGQDGQSVDAMAEYGQEGRKQGEGQGHREEDHQDSSDAQGSQHHVLEEEEPGEPGGGGDAGEEESTSRRGDGDCHGFIPGAGEELLTEAAHHEEGVVDGDADTQKGGDVEHEDGHIGELGHSVDEREGHGDGESAHGQGQAGGDDAAEDDHEGNEHQGEDNDLRATQVAGTGVVEVGEDGDAAGDLDIQAVGAYPGPELLVAVDGLVDADVQEHQGHGRMAVAGDEGRIARAVVGDDARHLGKRLQGPEHALHLLHEGRVVGLQGRTAEEDGQAGFRDAQAVGHELEAAARLHVGVAEAALQHRRRPGREEEGKRQDDGPQDHDEPTKAHDQEAQAKEHGSIVCNERAGRWRDGHAGGRLRGGGGAGEGCGVAAGVWGSGGGGRGCAGRWRDGHAGEGCEVAAGAGGDRGTP